MFDSRGIVPFQTWIVQRGDGRSFDGVRRKGLRPIISWLTQFAFKFSKLVRAGIFEANKKSVKEQFWWQTLSTGCWGFRNKSRNKPNSISSQTTLSTFKRHQIWCFSFYSSSRVVTSFDGWRNSWPTELNKSQFFSWCATSVKYIIIINKLFRIVKLPFSVLSQALKRFWTVSFGFAWRGF